MSNRKSLIRLALALLFCAGLLTAASPVYAYNGFLKNWTSLYPLSRTSQAGCATCHGSSTSTLNPYGRDLCTQLQGIVPKDVTSYLIAMESLDSDLDATGSSNIVEIGANAQPGWTAATPLFHTWSGGCAPTGAIVAPPSSVPLPYDPPAAGDPVAVPGGPYSGIPNVPIVFDGTGSFDTGGSIASYAWDFGDGMSAMGAVVSHAYSMAGLYTVTLTVVDDDGNGNTNETTAMVMEGTPLDLDAALTVSKTVRVGKAISIQLAVANNGQVRGQAIATVAGTLNGTEIYRWRLNVFDDPGGGTTTFKFPSYTAPVAGTIEWTATVADEDPDVDLATAITVVK